MKSTEKKIIPEIILENCSTEWIPFFELYATIEHYKKGELIFKEGNAFLGMHFLITGHAKVFKQLEKEKEYIVRLVKEGHILGLRGWGGPNIFPVSATALTEVKTAFIPLDKFDTLLKANPSLSHYLLDVFALELRNAEAHMMFNAHHEVKPRLANALLYNIEIFGFDPKEKNLLCFTLSRKDLASLSATTYESVVRLLSDMEKEGILKIEQKKLRITNLKALKKQID